MLAWIVGCALGVALAGEPDPLEAPAEPIAAASVPAALDALRTQHAEVVATVVGPSDDRDSALSALTTTLPAQVAEMERGTRAFLATNPPPEQAAEAQYLLGTARLHLADQGLGLAPPASMKKKETKAYREVLESQVYPTFRAVEQAALAELRVAASGKGPFAEHAAQKVKERAGE